MQMVKRVTRGVVLIGVLSMLGIIGGVPSAVATTSPIIASYNGGSIDLSQGWGTATVCVVTNTGANCFATPGDYQTWQSSQAQRVAALPLSGCSSNLKLYQNLNYGGNELIVSATLIWVNLANYSFSNVVSSYQVGACPVSMTGGPNGSGSVYPGATSAGSNVSWIGTAWNDRIQSVYIY